MTYRARHFANLGENGWMPPVGMNQGESRLPATRPRPLSMSWLSIFIFSARMILSCLDRSIQLRQSFWSLTSPSAIRSTPYTLPHPLSLPGWQTLFCLDLFDNLALVMGRQSSFRTQPHANKDLTPSTFKTCFAATTRSLCDPFQHRDVLV